MDDKSLHPIYTNQIDSRRQKRRLSAVLKGCEKFDNYYSPRAENEKARAALVDFFVTLLKEKPDRKPKINRSYYSFYINLLPLRQALIEKKYALACHELLTLCAYEPYMQHRIYACLAGLYRDYLEEYNELEGETENSVRKET